MRRFLGPLAGMFTTASLVLASGCGDSTPSVDTSTTEAIVKGTVFIKGKMASGGEIVFDPSNIKRGEAARKASIDNTGNYTIKALVGDNQVTIVGPELRKNAELQFERQRCVVKDGDNTIDVKFLEPK